MGIDAKLSDQSDDGTADFRASEQKIEGCVQCAVPESAQGRLTA